MRGRDKWQFLEKEEMEKRSKEEVTKYGYPCRIRVGGRKKRERNKGSFACLVGKPSW